MMMAKAEKLFNSIFCETFQTCVGSSAAKGIGECQLYFLTFVSPSSGFPAQLTIGCCTKLSVFVDPKSANESYELAVNESRGRA